MAKAVINMQNEIEVTSRDRARRFVLQMPLRYRVAGNGEWSKGTTENISCSGVLFRGEGFAEPDAPLEISLVLPEKILGERAAEVVCKGRVVRSRKSSRLDAPSELASTISRFRFIRS
jgi:hypothetical protein